MKFIEFDLEALQRSKEAFFKLVDKRGENDCWYWLGTVLHYSHKAKFKIPGPNGLLIYANRAAFALANNRLPVGIVKHSCDNPACVNPKHLSEGTYGENNHEMYERGRRPKKLKKLSDEEALQVLHYKKEGKSIYWISARIGVNPVTIADIGTRTRLYLLSTDPTHPPVDKGGLCLVI